MKKIKIAGFIKNSFVDYPTKISSVIFLGGCNFLCHYCHNNHLLNDNCNTIFFAEVLEELKAQIGFIDGVVISGGEPTLHPYLYDIIKAIKKQGFLVKLDTNGTNRAILRDLVEKRLVDYIAMDIKGPLARYPEIVQSHANMGEIERSILFLKKQQTVDYMFRTTLSPMLTEKDIKVLGTLVQGAKCFQLQQFVPNSFSNSHKTVLLPYSKAEAERFGLLIAKHVNKLVMRGF